MKWKKKLFLYKRIEPPTRITYIMELYVVDIFYSLSVYIESMSMGFFFFYIHSKIIILNSKWLHINKYQRHTQFYDKTFCTFIQCFGSLFFFFFSLQTLTQRANKSSFKFIIFWWWHEKKLLWWKYKIENRISYFDFIASESWWME